MTYTQIADAVVVLTESINELNNIILKWGGRRRNRRRKRHRKKDDEGQLEAKPLLTAAMSEGVPVPLAGSVLAVQPGGGDCLFDGSEKGVIKAVDDKCEFDLPDNIDNPHHFGKDTKTTKNMQWNMQEWASQNDQFVVRHYTNECEYEEGFFIDRQKCDKFNGPQPHPHLYDWCDGCFGVFRTSALIICRCCHGQSRIGQEVGLCEEHGAMVCYRCIEAAGGLESDESD